MSNTTAKVKSFIALGYSLLASQKTAETGSSFEALNNAKESFLYQNFAEEKILPNTDQIALTLLPNNPATSLII